MSLFKKIHTVKVPAEYQEKSAPPITLRFNQLNPKKMGKADLSRHPQRHRPAERRSWRRSPTSSVRRHSTGSGRQTPSRSKRAQERAEEPDEL